MNSKPTRIEYMCSYCGTKQIRGIATGKPQPGICHRKGKTSDGKSKPHTWIINRKI